MTTWMEAEQNVGRAEILIRLITIRFGAPSTDVVARLRAADRSTLDVVAERVMTARTVDELFS